MLIAKYDNICKSHGSFEDYELYKPMVRMASLTRWLVSLPDLSNGNVKECLILLLMGCYMIT